MSSKAKQAGFAVMEAVLVLVVLAAIAAGSYWVWKHKGKSYVAPKSTTVQHDSSKSDTSASDLDSQSKAVDGADPNVGTNDAAQMSTQANPFY